MDINTDVLRIGGNYYAVQRIEAQGIDMNEELKELYEARHAEHVRQLNDGVVATAMDDWNTQIRHIRQFNNRGSFAISPDLFDKMLMVYGGNRMLELRLITYAPCELVTSYGYLLNRRMTAASIPAIKTLVNYRVDASGVTRFDDDTIEIKFKKPYEIPLIVGYDKRGNSLWTPFFQTYHTMGGRSVCTGNHQAKDYWRLNDRDLAEQMNKVNLYSPATHIAGGVQLKDLVTTTTFLSCEKRGASTWNA